MSRTRGFTQAEMVEFARRAGIELPKTPQKYHSNWTYYDGKTMHTKDRDCPPVRCPVCLNQKVIDDREHWFQSRSEARFAAKCDLDLKLGLIRAHSRSPNIVLVPGTRAERVTYRPDRDVWITSDPAGPPDRRYEVKGDRGMISQQGLVRIKWYRSRSELPPLYVVNGDGEEIDLSQRRSRRRGYTARNMARGPVTDAAHA